MLRFVLVVVEISLCCRFPLCCANFVVLWLVSVVVKILFCYGLFSLCCANFVALRLASIVLC